MLSEDWPSLDVLRLRYIKQVLEHVQNNKTRAADLLGIDRRTLNRILSRTHSQRVRFGAGVTLADLNGIDAAPPR